MDLSWQTLDWGILDRLRARFLAREVSAVPYWTSLADLAHYDLTFAQRVGWKWDAVLRELALRGWQPPLGPLLDWGCGSGVAGRTVLKVFGAAHFGTLLVHDRSRLAEDFALAQARRNFPGLDARRFEPDVPFGTLVVSHVLNELNDAGRAALRALLARAEAVLWVEPGTFEDSRALIGFREELRDTLGVVAPCTHRELCGMLRLHNAPHWCHHFAVPPPGVLGDPDWTAFARRVGVDLRSLPYSFLVMARGWPETNAGWSRIIGRPRVYKGFAKVLDCSAEDVREAGVQRRDEPEVFRAWRDEAGPTLWRLEREKGWVEIEEAR